MTRRDTSIGGPRREFPATSWTLVLAAADPSAPACRAHLERLIALYWKPAYHYLRACGRGIEEAKDLVQEFFARLLEKDHLRRIRPDLGTFRGFLKRSLKHFMVDASRREAARRPGRFAFAFDECRDEPAAADPDGAFDREWFRTVLRASLDELRERLRASGRERDYEAFTAYCLPEGADGPLDSARALGPRARKTYRDVAERLGLTEDAVRKALERCRAELRAIALARIREYAADEPHVEAEFRELLR